MAPAFVANFHRLRNSLDSYDSIYDDVRGWVVGGGGGTQKEMRILNECQRFILIKFKIEI